MHFPIALLTIGFAAALWAKFRGQPVWMAEAASWLLWAGAALAWVAVGLGLLAESTAPHAPLAWQALEHHEDLAFWAAGSFTALALWRIYMGRKKEWIFLLGWLACLGLLLATGYFGGELVFRFGMGNIPQ